MDNALRIEELQSSINDCLMEIAEYRRRIQGLEADIRGMESELLKLQE